MKRAGWLAVALAVIGGCSSSSSTATDMSVAENPVDRGRYLVNNVGACGFCHTPINPDGSRDTTRLLSGIECLGDFDPTNDMVGCIHTRNLTNDATGLKNATNEQIKNAFRNGMRTDGKVMSPVMPYWLFHNMTDADADAIVAYLRTVPGVAHTVPANQPPFDPPPAVPATPIDPSMIPSPPTSHPQYAAAMRGRYLTAQVGLCIDCHTPDANPPDLSKMLIDISRPFAGGRMFFPEQLGYTSPPYPAMIFTANLTQDATGLLGWTLDQIKTAFKQGKDRDGKSVCAATHGLTTSPYAGLTDTDVNDIATYISTIPAIANARMDCVGP